MAKSLPLSREAIQKRIQDEMKGIRQDSDSVDFGVNPTHVSPAIPDIATLGIPAPVRKKLETLTANQLALGKIEREAKKDRDIVTKAIKDLLAEHVSDDVPSFSVGDCRVTRFTQNRPKFDKDVLRTELLNRGVKPNIIVDAMQAATTTQPVTSLKISVLSGDDDE